MFIAQDPQLIFLFCTGTKGRGTGNDGDERPLTAYEKRARRAEAYYNSLANKAHPASPWLDFCCKAYPINLALEGLIIGLGKPSMRRSQGGRGTVPPTSVIITHRARCLLDVCRLMCDWLQICSWLPQPTSLHVSNTRWLLCRAPSVGLRLCRSAP